MNRRPAPLRRPRALAALAFAATFAVLSTLPAGTAGALTAQVVPDRDNTLYESSTGALSNGAGPSFFAGRTAQPTNSIRRGLVHFDVAGAVPAGATITGATLTLNLTAAAPGSFAVGLHRVNDSWGEGTSNAGDGGGGGAPATANDATWRHRFFPATSWAVNGGEFQAAASASLAVGDVGAYTWGSTGSMVADVQAWLDTPGNNHGWLVRGVESSQPTSKKFESRESASPALRPLLVIEYTVPVPAAPATWGRVKAGYRD